MAPSITPITVKGRYFWKDDKRFMVNGVVYQPHEPDSKNHMKKEDPLSDDKIHYLRSSIPALKELKINTLVVFHLDGRLNHDASMNLLAEAGIYVLPGCVPMQDGVGLERKEPPRLYTLDILKCYFRSIDNMARYPNTLGLIVSYELIRNTKMTAMAPHLRAIIRDVKRYMRLASAKRSQRALPVGLVALDQKELLKPQFDYFAAEPEREAIDFFAFNNFRWVGRSSIEASGYLGLVEQFSSTPIPVFFSFYGNKTYPRLFQETFAMFTNKDMLRVFSGGAVYEFFQGSDQYGLVEAQERPAHADVHLTRLKEFRCLRESIRRSHVLLPAAMSNHFRASTQLRERPDPPEQSPDWQAQEKMPRSPVNWAELEVQMADGEWVDVAKELVELAIDDLASSIWEELNMDDINP
ncbi:glycoside hydrolase family 72 protein [Hypoxylon sp. FL0543]|nr:glycoside hydrolase family 72 protein [Hypoxylon sp. FL0543]